MKNLFTFIVALFMATGVYAQGTYAVKVGDKVNAGDKITSVENVTLTYMENAGVAFVDGKATTNWADADFTAYVCGQNSGKLHSDAEPTGCAYKFETVKAGSVTVAVQLNSGKGFHILDANFAEVTPASYNLPASNKTGTSQEFTKNEGGENVIGTKSNGIVTFDVAAGGTYYVLAAGTKMGFFGFKYLVNEKVTITDAGFATHASKFAVDYSNRTDGLEAYSVSYDPSSKELTYKKINGVVAAGKAVILKGKGNYILEASSKTATVTETGLETSDGTKKGATTIYCLANKNNIVGFYQVKSDVTIPANKAYLEINAENSAKYYSIGIGGNTTGIQAIQQNSVKADGIMYSLSGQRVGKDYKGIVICDGKKMIKK